MSLPILRSLLCSQKPLIAIDAAPDARADELVETVCRSLDRPLFIWSLEGSNGDRSAQEALNLIQSLGSEAVFLFEHLDSSSIESIWRVCGAAVPGSTLVLSGNGLRQQLHQVVPVDVPQG